MEAPRLVTRFSNYGFSWNDAAIRYKARMSYSRFQHVFLITQILWGQFSRQLDMAITNQTVALRHRKQSSIACIVVLHNTRAGK